MRAQLAKIGPLMSLVCYINNSLRLIVKHCLLTPFLLRIDFFKLISLSQTNILSRRGRGVCVCVKKHVFVQIPLMCMQNCVFMNDSIVFRHLT